MADDNDERPPDSENSGDEGKYKYDIAVSFAGEQREFVEGVVRGLNLPEARVFYDKDYKAELWGEDLAERFTRLYRDEARFVVMFISREYAEKEWCQLERRAALRRRMQTQGAYILPVRLDTTKLDEVEGLLGTIGDLDGVREGVPGVIECLRKKLATVLAESGKTVDKADDEPRFGEVQTTQEGLVALLQERPHSWRWAAFASVLVQRRAVLEAGLRDHRLGFAPQTNERVSDLSELQALVEHTMYDVEQVGHQINGFVQTEAFVSVFGAEDDESAADPEGIVHVANRLMDLYERYLQLAQRVHGVSAPARFVNVLDTCAHLVDGPLDGLDDFIKDYLAILEGMPARLLAAEGQTIIQPISLRIHVDDEVLQELLRQIRDLVQESNAGP